MAAAVEVVPPPAYLALPAGAPAVGGVEVVAVAADGGPAVVAAPVGVVPQLAAVGGLGDHAGLHDALPVEVVPLAADPLLPLNRLPVGAVVVGLASNRLPNIAVDFDN